MHTIAITFNDLPDVIHILPFTHQGAGVIELKLVFPHPRTNKRTTVYYRRTSLRGRNIYYYSEGNKAGEALGG
jgi:hypothetical protein